HARSRPSSSHTPPTTPLSPLSLHDALPISAAAAHGASSAAARRWIALAMLLGAAFIAVKLTEYGGEIAAGAGFETSPFFTLYFLDRKSTRLNSSHQIISYAVFCLKKKTD